MPEESPNPSPDDLPAATPLRPRAGTGFAGETTRSMADGPTAPSPSSTDATVIMPAGGGAAAQAIGDFEIIGKLGQGGMGAVYRARQVSLDRQVALKLLPSTLEADPDFVTRFQREARVAASLSHANLVKVYASGEVDGTHFIAMELIEGETLGDFLKRGPMEPLEALRVCGDAARALEYGWQKAQLVHRDIKPGNIFLSMRGEVKVGDLGLAKSVGGDTTGLTQTGTAMGTPHYISPEQARGDKDLDFRADIYSLGCTLFQMLTGRTPYAGRDPVAVMHQHLHGPPPAILKVWPQCPIPLARLVGKMLKKSKHERQASYAELLRQIDQVRVIYDPSLSATLAFGVPTSEFGTPEATPTPVTPLAVSAGGSGATPRAGDPGEGARDGSAAPGKSKATLYGGIAAAVIVIALAAIFWPREEKLTKAELYAREQEAKRAAAGNPAVPATPDTAAASGSAETKKNFFPLPMAKRPTQAGKVVVWRLDGQPVDPNDPEAKLPPGLDDVVQIEASGSPKPDVGAVVALKADGTVVAWGSHPNQVQVVPAGLNDVVTIASDGGLASALRADGQVVAWGRITDRVPPLSERVVQISGKKFRMVALTESGRVIPFGFGLMKDGKMQDSFVPPADLQGRAISVASAGDWSCAIRDDGTLFAWGEAAAPGVSNLVLLVPGALEWPGGPPGARAPLTDGRIPRFIPYQVLGRIYVEGFEANPVSVVRELPSYATGDSKLIYPGKVDLTGLESIQFGDGATALKIAGQWRFERIRSPKGPPDLTYNDSMAAGCVQLVFTSRHAFGIKPTEGGTKPLASRSWEKVDLAKQKIYSNETPSGMQDGALQLGRFGFWGSSQVPGFSSHDQAAMRVRYRIGDEAALKVTMRRHDGPQGDGVHIEGLNSTNLFIKRRIPNGPPLPGGGLKTGGQSPVGAVVEYQFATIGQKLYVWRESRLLGEVDLPADLDPGGDMTLQAGGKGDLIESIELLNLDGLPPAEALRLVGTDEQGKSSPEKAAILSAAEPWQNLLRDPSAFRLEGGVAQVAGGLSFASGGAVIAASDHSNRDGAVRLRSADGGMHAGARVRYSSAGLYQLAVRNPKTVSLHRRDSATSQTIVLAEYPLREPLRAGEPFTLELRVVGTKLTSKLNGEVLGSVEDATYREGRFGAGWNAGDRANPPTLINSLEFLDLDTPPSAAATPPDGGTPSVVSPSPEAGGRDGSPSRPGALGESALLNPPSSITAAPAEAGQNAVGNVGLILSSKSWQWITLSIAEGKEGGVFGPVVFRLDGSARGLGFVEKWEAAGANRFKIHNKDRQKFWLFELSSDQREARTIPGGTMDDDKLLRAIEPPPSAATRNAPFVNSLGMKFVPVPITGGPTGGKRVLFSIWETRVQDFEPYLKEKGRKVAAVGFEQGPTHPALNVNWLDAQEFCTWLTARERQSGQLPAGFAYRLPSDHEWSCAVGLGSREDGSVPLADKNGRIRNLYPWGEAWPPSAGAGNLRGEEALVDQQPWRGAPVIAGYRDGFPWSAPVGSFAANALGIHDLAGSAWEWCAEASPQDPAKRIKRGGSLSRSDANVFLSSARSLDNETNGSNDNGFRIVLAPAL